MRGGLQKTAVWAAQGEVFSAPFGRRSRSARFAAGLCAGLAAAREFIDDFKTPINKKYFCRGGFGRRRGGFGRRGAAVSARRGAVVCARRRRGAAVSARRGAAVSGAVAARLFPRGGGAEGFSARRRKGRGGFWRVLFSCAAAVFGRRGAPRPNY